MSTHYYLSWFNNFFPEKLVHCLHEDIQDRKSLVMISAEPSGYTGEQINIDDVSECTWLDQANIIFDEYHFIDYRMQKKDAQRLIHNASGFRLKSQTVEVNKEHIIKYTFDSKQDFKNLFNFSLPLV